MKIKTRMRCKSQKREEIEFFNCFKPTKMSPFHYDFPFMSIIIIVNRIEYQGVVSYQWIEIKILDYEKL